MPTMRMSDPNKRARETFLFNIANNPRMAIEAAKESFSTFKEIAGSPTVANANTVKIMALFCSQFSCRAKETHHYQSDPGKDKFLSECLFGMSALLKAFNLKGKPISIVASAWPSITTWMAHIFEDVYPFENSVDQVAWGMALMNACKVGLRAGLEIDTLRRIVAKLWIKVEDSTISRALWLCSEESSSTSHTTQYFSELGLSPNKAAELAVDRLLRAFEEFMLRPGPTMWTEVISRIYGCLAVAISPDTSFGAAMLRKNAFSTITKIIRSFRVRHATPAQRRKRSAFRIHALNALLIGFDHLDSDYAIRSLSQALRKGLIAVMLATLLSVPRLDKNERDSGGSLRESLFGQFSTLLEQKSVVSAAGEGMAYFNSDLMRKLSASDLHAKWLKFEEQLLERFILYRMNCYLRQTEEYPCSNKECGVVLPGSEMLKCAHCKTTLYCSKACQKKDWREDGHRLSCTKPVYNRWNKRYLQTIASNAIIRALPRIEQFASEKSLSARQLAYTVSFFNVSCTRIDIIDLRDKSMWKEGCEHYYEDALEDAKGDSESKSSYPPTMVVEVRYPLDKSGSEESYAHFMFSERFPTYDALPDIKTGRAICGCGEELDTNRNQLDCVVECVRNWVRQDVGDSSLDQGWWTEGIVDVFVMEVDKAYGSNRDIIGQPMYPDVAHGEFLN